MTPSTPPTELILLPSLRARRGPNGGFILTQKYLDGAAEYSKSWPGPVTSLVHLDPTPTSDMDHVEIFPDKLGTGLEVRPDNEAELEKRLSGAAAVLAFLSKYEVATAELCRRIGVPIIFTSEYSPTTERQIVDAETLNPVLRLRRKLWIRSAEVARRSALNIAAGLQCSGTPTYDLYQALNPNTLLFFDNRVPEADAISDADFERKVQGILSGQPLRLIFGGRLIAMKGVAELPRVAAELKQRGVPFTMDIYGSGPLEPKMAQKIRGEALNEHVRLRGALDFRTGWVPTLKEQSDLFVCCHPQGDPSSTYPEVMSCGVPIAGYDNEAFQGIVLHSQSGWLASMNNPSQLADIIAGLHENRTALVENARRARLFANAHCFERTMARRVQHMATSSRLPDELKVAVTAQ